ncbi:hypothetical protein O181_070895 [Austropuccinia psidii MF-1]|uniref:Uncharacterized protein n=1 Tax=Austropuccinia psidii MF-1 TaxID=1389203 RepID=A0A9Q3EXE6_9BASI|nr:hypothetical protein [Austropuccinia psidii MF-1]
MYQFFEYAKHKWDKNHTVPDFKVGDLSLVQTFTLRNIKGINKLNYSYLQPSFITSLHGTNAIQVELRGEWENKHSTLPVSLIKPHQQSDEEFFS